MWSAGLPQSKRQKFVLTEISILSLPKCGESEVSAARHRMLQTFEGQDHSQICEFAPVSLRIHWGDASSRLQMWDYWGGARSTFDYGLHCISLRDDEQLFRVPFFSFVRVKMEEWPWEQDGGSGYGVGGGGQARRSLQCGLGVHEDPCCIGPRIIFLSGEVGQQVEIG